MQSVKGKHAFPYRGERGNRRRRMAVQNQGNRQETRSWRRYSTARSRQPLPIEGYGRRRGAPRRTRAERRCIPARQPAGPRLSGHETVTGPVSVVRSATAFVPAHGHALLMCVRRPSHRARYERTVAIAAQPTASCAGRTRTGGRSDQDDAGGVRRSRIRAATVNARARNSTSIILLCQELQHRKTRTENWNPLAVLARQVLLDLIS